MILLGSVKVSDPPLSLINLTYFCLDFDCKYCGKRFKDRSVLKVHVRDIHDNFIQHDCPFCGKLFKSKNTLANHKSLYHKGPQI